MRKRKFWVGIGSRLVSFLGL
uniref:Uncharacterized protein n=1 Tax=Rhizophora mucronata TaxID=61149 RepID=A0A2P2IQ01_RHIMU